MLPMNRKPEFMYSVKCEKKYNTFLRQLSSEGTICMSFAVQWNGDHQWKIQE